MVDEHMDAIREETLFNQRSLAYAIQYDSLLLLKVDSLINGLRDPDTDLRWIDKKCNELLMLTPLYIKRNAYNSLIESGDVRYIKEFDQKQSVINLYEYYRWLESFNGTLMHLYQDRYYAYLMDYIDVNLSVVQPREVYYALPFKNAVDSYRYLLDRRRSKYKDCLVVIDQYLSEAE